MDILFSVIIPTYNRRHLLAECLDSVFAQTYKNFEVIVIDDWSTDDTAVYLASIHDPRLHVYLNTNRQPQPVTPENRVEERSCRNVGLEKAIGDFCCFIDDDDFILPTFLSDFYEASLKIDISSLHKTVFRTNYIKRFEDGRPDKLGPSYNALSYAIFGLFAYQEFCGVWSLAIPKEVYKKFYSNPEYVILEDTHYIIKIYDKDLEFNEIQASNYIYRIHTKMGSLANTTATKLNNTLEISLRAIESMYAILQKKTQVDKNIFNSVMAKKKLEYVEHFFNLRPKPSFHLGFHYMISALRHGLHLQNIKHFYFIGKAFIKASFA